MVISQALSFESYKRMGIIFRLPINRIFFTICVVHYTLEVFLYKTVMPLTSPFVHGARDNVGLCLIS